MKKEYHSPVIETEKLFDVEAGEWAVLARCWGLMSPNEDGKYSHKSGGRCKD